jgi:zinc and cadmium transporter
MQLVMSGVGGLVLGVGLLHLLPHSVAETGSMDQSVWAALAGLLTMFFLIRTFSVHRHGPVEGSPGAADEHTLTACGDHHHDYPTAGEHCLTHQHPYSWVGLCAGLTLHTLLDGMAIAASVSAEARAGQGGGLLLGLGTFFAVLLHKPLDAMSITSVMAAGGWSAQSQRVVNLGFAAMNAVGAAVFCLGVQMAVTGQHLVIGWALGFSAGLFLCIALADILPEVQFHAHDRTKLSLALVVGVLFAYAIGFAESPHQHGNPPSAEHHDHQ